MPHKGKAMPPRKRRDPYRRAVLGVLVKPYGRDLDCGHRLTFERRDTLPLIGDTVWCRRCDRAATIVRTDQGSDDAHPTR